MKANIEHMMTFIAVVEQGSFTAAAKSLRVSKSVVSKHISQLEDRLRQTFFIRSTRELQITDAGKLFYREIKYIPNHIEQAIDSLQDLHQQPSGNLSVIAPANFSQSLQKGVIPEFLKTYQQIQLNLRFARPVFDYVSEPYDVIILWKFSHNSFLDYQLVAKKLFTMPIGIYATPEYCEQYGKPDTPQALINHNCLCSVTNKWLLRDKSGQETYQYVKGNLITTNDDIIRSVVLNHMGIAYAYPYLFHQALQQGDVVPILQEYSHLMVDVYAFYHPHRYYPAKITAFVEYLQSYYQHRQAEILKCNEDRGHSDVSIGVSDG